jgi:hypothetical protein
MAWDPSVLRKYNTTGHFRLLNQLRGELKDNPLVRPKAGETVGDANRSRALIRLLEGRQGFAGRARRQFKATNLIEGLAEAPAGVAAPLPIPGTAIDSNEDSNFASFRARLNAVQLR